MDAHRTCTAASGTDCDTALATCSSTTGCGTVILCLRDIVTNEKIDPTCEDSEGIDPAQFGLFTDRAFRDSPQLITFGSTPDAETCATPPSPSSSGDQTSTDESRAGRSLQDDSATQATDATEATEATERTCDGRVVPAVPTGNVICHVYDFSCQSRQTVRVLPHSNPETLFQYFTESRQGVSVVDFAELSPITIPGRRETTRTLDAKYFDMRRLYDNSVEPDFLSAAGMCHFEDRVNPAPGCEFKLSTCSITAARDVVPTTCVATRDSLFSCSWY